MRVVADTNILVSAALKQGSLPNLALNLRRGLVTEADRDEAEPAARSDLVLFATG